MPTYEQIREQISNLDGMSQFLGKREIKELPDILWENENIEKIVQGIYNGGNGILVCTNNRLIFIDKGLLYGLRVEDFPMEKISSIQYSTGLLMGKLTIYASGNKAVIDGVEKTQVRVFGDYVTNKINSQKSNKKDSSDNSDNDDIVTKLERLAALKEKGILTEEEFLTQKSKILNS
jgi:hypothetical protein